MIALALKALRALSPQGEIWRDFPYEYERGRLAIDLINGGERLREWVDDDGAAAADLDRIAVAEEQTWRDERDGVLLYR